MKPADPGQEKIANWQVGIVNCLAWLILLWINAIYLNALLQHVYIAIRFGWPRPQNGFGPLP